MTHDDIVTYGSAVYLTCHRTDGFNIGHMVHRPTGDTTRHLTSNLHVHETVNDLQVPTFGVPAKEVHRFCRFDFGYGGCQCSESPVCFIKYNWSWLASVREVTLSS